MAPPPPWQFRDSRRANPRAKFSTRFTRSQSAMNDDWKNQQKGVEVFRWEKARIRKMNLWSVARIEQIYLHTRNQSVRASKWKIVARTNYIVFVRVSDR